MPPYQKPTIACLLCLAWGFVAVSQFGCSRRPRLVPVSGQVLIDGKPITAGFIRVVPNNARAAQAQIGPDGRFTLGTFDKNDGCVPGTHQVIVSAFDQSGGGLRWLAPQKYCDRKTSGLSVEITGPTDSLTIQLTWEGVEQTEEVPTYSEGDVDPAQLE